METNFKFDAVPCWDGNPIQCRVVSITVRDSPEAKFYWARPYVGRQRQALEVTADGKYFFYLDNADGLGIYKVTNGGGFRLGHRSLYPEPYTNIIEVDPGEVVYPNAELYRLESEKIEYDCTILYGDEYTKQQERSKAMLASLQNGSYMENLRRKV